MIQHTIKSIISTNRSTVLITDDSKKALKQLLTLLPNNVLVIDLPELLSVALTHVADDAQVDPKILQRALTAPIRSDLDYLAILKTRARDRVFAGLKQHINGIILVGIDEVEGYEIERYLGQLSERTYDRDNKNAFVIAISSKRILGLTPHNETPENWGGSLPDYTPIDFPEVCDKSSVSQIATKIDPKRLAAIKISDDYDLSIQNSFRVILEKLTKASKTTLVSILAKNARSDNPTKKAMRSAKLELSLLNKAFYDHDSADTIILEWYRDRSNLV